MKATKTKRTAHMNIVCADIHNEKLYVTSGTMKRSILSTEEASLINEYKERYPEFEIEVNDLFFLSVFGVIPA